MGEIIRDILLLQNFVEMHLIPNEIQAENQGLESEDGMNLQEQIR